MPPTFVSTLCAPSEKIYAKDRSMYTVLYREYLAASVAFSQGNLHVADRCVDVAFSRDVRGHVVETGESGVDVVHGGEPRPLGVVDVSCRGPNWERNRVNRVAQKNRKVKRQNMGIDWRVKRAVDSSIRTDVPSVRSWVVGQESCVGEKKKK